MQSWEEVRDLLKSVKVLQIKDRKDFMTKNLVETYGQVIELGTCIAGQNLNTLTLRGYGSLKVLADISGGDIYDQVNNPLGTQRDLKVKHSREALQYALESLSLTADESPHAFPEITLNVRDTNVLIIHDSNGNEIDFSSLGTLDSTSTYSVKIRAVDLQWPTPDYSPQISRVDGNHRLSQASDMEGEIGDEMPSVPFSLFVGLSTLQERKLFSDINGKHEGMKAAILTTFTTEALSDDVAVAMPDHRAGWIARQLTEEGMVFHGKVNFGGSVTGMRDTYGTAPALTIQGLKSAVQITLDRSPSLTAYFFPSVDLTDPANNTEARKRERVEKAKSMVKLLNRYWTAVRDSNAIAWENKKDFILMNSIGLNGFASLAGPVMENLVLTKGKSDYQHFKAVTDYVADRMELSREKYKGIAGAGGAKVVATELMEIWAQSDVNTAIAATDLNLTTDPLSSI